MSMEAHSSSEVRSRMMVEWTLSCSGFIVCNEQLSAGSMPVESLFNHSRGMKQKRRNKSPFMYQDNV